MEEVWKSIPFCDKGHQVSNLGNVRSINYNRTGNIKNLSPRLTNGGYLQVCIWVGNKRRHFSVHRLVAITFIPNLSNLPCVNHINAIKTDNTIQNLEWCTVLHNNLHAIRNGLNIMSKQGRDNIGKSTIERCSKKVIDLNSGKNFNSVKEMAIYFKCSSQHLSKILSGGYKNRKYNTSKYNISFV